VKGAIMKEMLKKTRHESSISYGDDDVIKMLQVDNIRVVSQITGEHLADLDPRTVLESGKKLPLVDDLTGRFKGYSSYYVYNF
jgi:hypothetical protein